MKKKIIVISTVLILVASIGIFLDFRKKEINSLKEENRMEIDSTYAIGKGIYL